MTRTQGAEAGEFAAALPRAIVPAAHMHLLVVGDDLAVLGMLRARLTSDGHEVVAVSGARSGIDAIDAAAQVGRPFDVVIADLAWPFVDGPRVADVVRVVDPDTAAIMLTGRAQRSIAEGVIRARVDLVLDKPLKLHALRAALAQLALCRPGTPSWDEN